MLPWAFFLIDHMFSPIGILHCFCDQGKKYRSKPSFRQPPLYSQIGIATPRIVFYYRCRYIPKAPSGIGPEYQSQTGGQMNKQFSLTLFSTQPAFIREATAAGIDEVIVDWECHGKELRQISADTEINRDTVDDLRRVRASTTARVICRINPYGETTPAEIEDAIDAGADEILVPMIRKAEEVSGILGMVRGRCGGGILVETVDAVGSVDELARLPLSRVYVGLNDLAIERNTPNIFTAVADGTLDRIRRPFRVPFGFGGLTLPDRGDPVPCRLLIGELARLDCSFSFLRRSFYRDIRGGELSREVPRIRAALEEAFQRTPGEKNRDREELVEVIGRWKEPREQPR